MPTVRSPSRRALAFAAMITIGCATVGTRQVEPEQETTPASGTGDDPPGQTAAPVAAPSTSGTKLPETLSHADIQDGAGAAKEAAKERCKALAHGSETVRIKVSIAGSSGAVVDAVPETDTPNPALADCAAQELRAASFRRAQKARTSVVLTVSF